MEKTTEPVVQIRDWSIDRIHYLADTGDLMQQFDAVAISEEFDEWIYVLPGEGELEYLVLEDQTFEDREIDI